MKDSRNLRFITILVTLGILSVAFQNCSVQTSPGGEGSGNSSQTSTPGQVTCNGGITMSCNPGDQVSCNGQMLICPGGTTTLNYYTCTALPGRFVLHQSDCYEISFPAGFTPTSADQMNCEGLNKAFPTGSWSSGKKCPNQIGYGKCVFQYATSITYYSNSNPNFATYKAACVSPQSWYEYSSTGWIQQ
jgi:hypothetical protein